MKIFLGIFLIIVAVSSGGMGLSMMGGAQLLEESTVYTYCN